MSCLAGSGRISHKFATKIPSFIIIPAFACQENPLPADPNLGPVDNDGSRCFNPLVFWAMRQNYANPMMRVFFRATGVVRWVFAFAVSMWICGVPAFARPFTVRLAALKPAIEVPVKVRDELIAPNFSQVERRVQAAELDPRVEPLYLSVPKDDDERAAFALKLARPKNYRQLMARLDQEITKPEVSIDSGAVPAAVPALQSVVTGNQNNAVNPVAGDDRVKQVRVRVRPELLRLMAPEAVTSKLQRTHLHVSIDSSDLLDRPELRTELLIQLAPFSGAMELRKVAEKMRQAVPLELDEDLLPVGARRAVKTFELYRGPNCFMTALAFQYPKMVRSQLVNIRTEQDHHDVMINNDELWRVLQSSFYEIDPARSPLKFGDMIVFFQLPASGKTPSDQDISYRWIKHATTFMFNDFVYSKGSKSPNSPYLVGTLRSEWRAWEKHVAAGGGTLGAKVFRKPLKSATSRPPKSLDDWMY